MALGRFSQLGLYVRQKLILNGLESAIARLSSNKACMGELSNVTLITRITEVTCDHLTPEIRLRLITPSCELWYTDGTTCPFHDPFWAFYWPGGQVLARFLLDNSHYIKGHSVLDLGSGCGALAIVSKLLGATHVIANDIDPVAITAIRMNSALNNISVETDTRNLIGQDISDLNIVLLGDMLYDISLCKTISNWLQSLSNKTLVLVGDPGRAGSNRSLNALNFKKLAEYELPARCKLENYGHILGSVWQLKKA